MTHPRPSTPDDPDLGIAAQNSDLSDQGAAPDFLRLIRDAKNGCSQSLEKLICECQPYLLAIANGELDNQISPKVGASDIVQNSILSAQRCIADFRGENRAELLAWLRGILMKDLQQTRRHYHAEKRHVDRERPMRDDSLSVDRSRFVDGGDSPSTAAVRQEQEDLLHQAMKSLSEDERRVIELRNWQRLPFAEIGDAIGRSPDATRKLWSRAIVQLQKQLDRRDG